MIPDYKVIITIKNNYMLDAMREKGFKTATELSRISGVQGQVVGHYLNLKLTPFTKKGGLRPSMARICTALGKLPEDLFPPQHIENALKKNKATFELDFNQVNNIIGYNHSEQQKIEYKESVDTVKGVIERLPQREQNILRERFGFSGSKSTYDQLATRYGVSKERIRQLELKALSSLKKHPKELTEAKRAILT